MRTSRKSTRKPPKRREFADMTAQLAALHEMTVSELRTRYQEVFGEPSHSRNRDYLRKKIGWRIQELAEGGLSDRALARIEELIPGASLHWPRKKRKGVQSKPKKPKRDPRLPAAGTVLTRIYQGAEHAVTVLEKGFEYRDKKYRSLSGVAREITGTRWNGFLFFNIESRGHTTSNEAAE
jgi:hypothetical protein